MPTRDVLIVQVQFAWFAMKVIVLSWNHHSVIARKGISIMEFPAIFVIALWEQSAQLVQHNFCVSHVLTILHFCLGVVSAYLNFINSIRTHVFPVQ